MIPFYESFTQCLIKQQTEGRISLAFFFFFSFLFSGGGVVVGDPLPRSSLSKSRITSAYGPFTQQQQTSFQSESTVESVAVDLGASFCILGAFCLFGVI